MKQHLFQILLKFLKNSQTFSIRVANRLILQFTISKKNLLNLI